MKQAIIITIGDELLIGQVVDTNSAWMAQRLNEWGYEVFSVVSVHDNAEQIVSALAEAEQRADLVLLTGGLGPTKDDITKHTLCRYFGTELVYRQDIREHLEQLYANRPDVLNRLTDTQCLFPANATLLSNAVGSAQAMLWTPQPSSLIPHPSTVISMPGVPYEMMWIMEHSVREVMVNGYGLQVTGNESTITHRTIQVTGIPESALAILIEDWENALPNGIHLAYLPKDGIIRLRLSGYGVPAEQVESERLKLLEILNAHNPDLVVATEDKPVEVLVGECLKQRHQTIATAESCTGGKIAQQLNRHPGSSAFYFGSVVAYDNSVKQHVLGVSRHDLDTVGAVSEPVVRQMAEGVRLLLHTDYAIATSGIAGPDGGTPDKPVGTVWIAIATPDDTYAQCFQLGKLREQITDRATLKALIWLLKILKK